ncbi:MAG TPA: GNAT family N-acetyltransferase [Fermentimonas caenicola]|jgi:N-acetylglutamate synthase-like GNAT family acetyltransferase|uniref:GNAT family N-acetyltransferase n=1 Tax=Lascolabacillus TaxID=1924067 RepID=UPI0006B33011|nr:MULTISPECIES: GNAT family N-acetyltransferase [Lascolabacillus]MBP6175256.1 GNAT family N-acetyltransferase [Fermentimonas sp.]MDI9625942.1 GNAT family N-acetyltransferase [Bacteroidota bacterium]TAH61466.1 MAG: GNAT family N-acetyltransferase [Fermentimonas caenicola]MBP6196891.1 GNAT family N-acetyltransferase [Fermentimonas sp.]MBP7104189.1 GNAT family N-acetyltransferase [Fermentimonas sp.]
MNVEIHIANSSFVGYSQEICDLIYESAQARGTGIAKRSAEYVAEKIEAGKAVIALDGDKLVGFSYIETFSHKRFVANSGLIVHPDYRNQGLAKKIKRTIFDLSRKLYPNAKIFSITTGLAVMRMNTELGFKPVTFSELTDDEEFWNGCKGCRNYDILQRNNFKMCLCTGLLYDPKDPSTQPVQKPSTFAKKVVKPVIKTRKPNKLYKK